MVIAYFLGSLAHLPLLPVARPGGRLMKPIQKEKTMDISWRHFTSEELLNTLRYPGKGRPPPYTNIDIAEKLGGYVDPNVLDSRLRGLEQRGRIIILGDLLWTAWIWDREALESGETATVLYKWWRELYRAAHAGDIDRSSELLALDLGPDHMDDED